MSRAECLASDMGKKQRSRQVKQRVEGIRRLVKNWFGWWVTCNDELTENTKKILRLCNSKQS